MPHSSLCSLCHVFLPMCPDCLHKDTGHCIRSLCRLFGSTGLGAGTCLFGGRSSTCNEGLKRFAVTCQGFLGRAAGFGFCFALQPRCGAGREVAGLESCGHHTAKVESESLLSKAVDKVLPYPAVSSCTCIYLIFCSEWFSVPSCFIGTTSEGAGFVAGN